MAENPATNRLFASAGPKVRLGWTKALPWLDGGIALAGRRQKDVFFRSFKTMNYAVF